MLRFINQLLEELFTSACSAVGGQPYSTVLSRLTALDVPTSQEFPLSTSLYPATITLELFVHNLALHTFCERFLFFSKDVNYEELARCTDDFNGAQCKAVCVEAVCTNFCGVLKL